MNTYGYVYGNPIIYYDFYGLDKYYRYFPNGIPHAGAGDSPTSSYGRRPSADSNMGITTILPQVYVPAEVSKDPETGAVSVKVPMTKEQDIIFDACMLRNTINPSLYNARSRNCVDLVRDCFREAGIEIETESMWPSSLYEELRKKYGSETQSDSNCSGGCS